MNSELQNQFHNDMLSLYWAAGKATKVYWPNYYLRKVRNLGGLKAAIEWLSIDKEQSGLGRLQELGRVDLTFEALIWDNKKYHELFTASEMQTVRNRLIKVGYIK